MKSAILVVLTLIPFTLHAQRQRSIRICTYNVLHLGDNDAERAGAFRTVLEAVRPDILVCQEVDNESGLAFLIDSAFQAAGIAGMRAAPFNDGPDSDNGLLYNSFTVAFLGADYYSTELRDLAAYTLLPIGSTDTTVVISVHLKAGDDSESEMRRSEEAGTIVNVVRNIPGDWHVAVAGDLNLYGSSEAAYRTLTGVPSGKIDGEDGPPLNDPMEMPGEWDNRPEYAEIHTQSTRDRQFGGGVRGGMDSRFDFILLSPSLMPHYTTGSYTAFGNDGLHFNDSVNAQPNNAVPPLVAQALFDASDHVPVFLDLDFSNTASDVGEELRHEVRFGIW